MTDPAARNAALAEIARLAAAHDLTAADIAAALAAPGEQVLPRSALSRVLAYLGGMFLFAGIAIFVAIEWPEMGSAARLVATLGTGLAAFGMAVAAFREPRFQRAATPLLVIAAALEPTGILVAIDEFATGGDWRYAVLTATGAVAAQQLVTFLALRWTAVLFFALLFGAGFAGTGMDLLGMSAGLIGFTVGASLVSLAVAAARTAHAAVAPFWLFAGASIGLAGCFDLLEGTPIEPAFLGPAGGLVYLSTVLRSRALLVVGTVAILSYLGYFTADRFADAAGWPLALIAFGFVMIGLSAVAVQLDRRYIAPG